MAYGQVYEGYHPNAGGGNPFAGGGGFDSGGMGAGIAQLLSGLFGNSAGPYHEYIDQQKKGLEGYGGFEDWLNTQKNPTEFINHIMGQYQESPFAKYQQQQSIRAGQNAGSAAGLTGSTALAQQLQQNASNISSQDMNQWLQNVLGINSQYGQGQYNLGGAKAGIYDRIGQGAYGARAGENQDFFNILGGAGQVGGSIASAFV
jgi:hypothetical protein